MIVHILSFFNKQQIYVNISNSVLEIKGKIVSIDGNIGAGKSSTLKELKNLGYVVFPEDIYSWQPILNNFYSDPKRWAFTLQIIPVVLKRKFLNILRLF